MEMMTEIVMEMMADNDDEIIVKMMTEIMVIMIK